MLDCPAQGLWVVADGMGGHQSGDLASRLVVDSLSAMAPAESLDGQIEVVLARLQKLTTICAASPRVCSRAGLSVARWSCCWPERQNVRRFGPAIAGFTNCAELNFGN